MDFVADKDWYQSVSEKKSLPLRCPFATAERCPRYYQSLSLFPSLGGTAMDPKEEERLLEKWEKSELWPRIDEHATSTFSSSEKLISISNYCPELTFDRYGYFCSSLGAYADELDSVLAQERLHKEGVGTNDPRWYWAHSYRMHYSECPLYSLLPDNQNTDQELNEPKQEVVSWWKEHLIQIVVAIIGAFATALFAFLFS
ncbi:MAG: hypothetical protein RPU52_13240 [Candidatus Sedimenticola sp. (ex Thyasira tokunagai)]